MEGENSIDSIKRGAIFCHVERRRQVIHEDLAITLGNQKWAGAAPSLTKRASVRRRWGD